MKTGNIEPTIEAIALRFSLPSPIDAFIGSKLIPYDFAVKSIRFTHPNANVAVYAMVAPKNTQTATEALAVGTHLLMHVDGSDRPRYQDIQVRNARIGLFPKNSIIGIAIQGNISGNFEGEVTFTIERIN